MVETKNGAKQGEVILEMRDICKNFPGVKALQHVNFDLRRGEVHVLLGENGAGKSTLIKILTGAYTPTSGEILLKGKPIQINGPIHAQQLGISAVYQEFNLTPFQSVAENIFLGRVDIHKVLYARLVIAVAHLAAAIGYRPFYFAHNHIGRVQHENARVFVPVRLAHLLVRLA
jgi:ABC-type sugar transport system ATPase subunit